MKELIANGWGDVVSKPTDLPNYAGRDYGRIKQHPDWPDIVLDGEYPVILIPSTNPDERWVELSATEYVDLVR